MKTIILSLDEGDMREPHSGLEEGGRILRQGGLVAFPTETVYGLGADGLNTEAVKKIYQAKGRPSDNPLILHIASIEKIKELAVNIPERAQILMEKFWPGPLTMVFNKKKNVPDQVTGGLDTVAVRMPSHPIARNLIAAAQVPVAAPSANLSGRPSPTEAKHVIRDLEGRVDMIIDGGPCQKGIESTVIDFTSSEPILLRPGSIPLEEIEAVIDTVRIDEGIIEQADIESPRSPGMKYKHYSPRAELRLIEGKPRKVKEKIEELVSRSQKRLGLLATRQMVESLGSDLPPMTVKVMGERDDLEGIANRLFKLLREFDETDVELVFVEGLPLKGMGLAIMNRLRKAAGYQIIKA